MKIDSNDAESQVALGVASRGDGKFDQARKAYERALDIEPDYPPALYDLGVLYMDFNKEPGQGQGPPQSISAGGRQGLQPGGRTPRRGSRSSNETSHESSHESSNEAPSRSRSLRSRSPWQPATAPPGEASQATRGGPQAGARSRAGAERGTRRRQSPTPKAESRQGGEASGEAASDDAKPAGEAKAGGKNIKTKTYTFGAMDVEGKLKTPQLLYFLNRVKLELDMSAPDKRSFMKELGQSADDKSL